MSGYFFYMLVNERRLIVTTWFSPVYYYLDLKQAEPELKTVQFAGNAEMRIVAMTPLKCYAVDNTHQLFALDFTPE
jgi:hypothetical protein